MQIKFKCSEHISLSITCKNVYCAVFSVSLSFRSFFWNILMQGGEGILFTVFKPFFGRLGFTKSSTFTLSTVVSTFHLSSSVLPLTSESWLPCPSPKGRQKVKQMAELWMDSTKNTSARHFSSPLYKNGTQTNKKTRRYWKCHQTSNNNVHTNKQQQQ